MRECLSLLFVAVIAFLHTGCNISDAGCVSDDECREGRICSSGVCTGLVQLETDMGTPSSNNAVTNNVLNNGSTSNATTNNVISCSEGGECGDDEWCDDGADQCVQACQSAADCTDVGAPVCSWLDGDSNRLTCTVAEMCGFTNGFGGEGRCHFEWDCADGVAIVECQVLVDGTSNCPCIRADGAEIGEFEFEGNICTATDAEVADAVNVGCGWRVPLSRAP